MGNRAGSSPVTRTIYYRGVAQVVAHQTGGLGVASSSLVTPTIGKIVCMRFTGSLFCFIHKTGKIEEINVVFEEKRHYNG